MAAGIDGRLDLLRRIAALPATERMALERQAIAPYFDAVSYRRWYLGNVPDADPLDHFCRLGWRAAYRPHARFDPWWYRRTFMADEAENVNPLLHYALVGTERGLPSSPNCPEPRPSAALDDARGVRRAILVAGYEPAGRVSAATMLYLEELARHGEVLYWCDADLAPQEIARLEAVATVVRAQRHGGYDFGSYAALVRLVGWDTLMSYDEVLLVNDSCFLLGALDGVFSSMAATACDWWGLQSTEQIASVRFGPTETVHMRGVGPVSRLTEPLPVCQGAGPLRAMFEELATDFHLGSYFLAFRRPVLANPLFRGLIEEIAQENSKYQVVQKYEVGLSQLLIDQGHRFATWIPELYPFHPMVSDQAFLLIERGLPLLKRSLFTENPFGAPDLRWYRKRVAPHFPDAPFDLIDPVARRAVRGR